MAKVSLNQLALSLCCTAVSFKSQNVQSSDLWPLFFLPFCSFVRNHALDPAVVKVGFRCPSQGRGLRFLWRGLESPP